jgi:hypothetical protein
MARVWTASVVDAHRSPSEGEHDHEEVDKADARVRADLAVSLATEEARDGEEEGRAYRRPNQELAAASEAVDRPRAEERASEGGDRVHKVQRQLLVLVDDARVGEEDGEEVRDHAVARKLAERADHHDDVRPVPVLAAPEERAEVPEALVRAVDLHALLDFLDLEVDQRGVEVAGGGMKLCENAASLVWATVGVEPTRTKNTVMSK